MSNSFTCGFSEKLTKFVIKHQPVSCELNFEQIKQLADLAEYQVVGKDKHNFVLYGWVGGPGIDSGILIDWFVSQLDNQSLMYRPIIKPRISEGRHKPDSDMINRLSLLLPKIGLQERMIVPLDEPVLILHGELQKLEHPVIYMYLSEFKEKYYQLYRDLYKVFEQ